MNTWSIQVKLKNDESISSWLIRSALANGCDPLVLTSKLWPKWRMWTTDIDRGIVREKLEILKYYSIVPLHKIRNAAISNEAKLIASKSPLSNGTWPWVQGLGVRNRKYRGGLQYCPLCFSNDKNPYYRRHWRFSWVTGCEKHQVRLVDKCFKCKKPLEPHRLESINAFKISLCSTCGFDLSHSPINESSYIAQCFQKRAFKVLCSNFGNIIDKRVSVDEWFNMVRHLIYLIRRSTVNSKTNLNMAFESIGVDVKIITNINLFLQLELLPITVREPLFINVEVFLRNIIEFSEYLKNNNVNRNCVTGKFGYLPPSLFLIFKQLKLNHRVVNYISDKKIGLPKSKTNVLKSWMRFKRRNRLN
jgi:hypothetical protein